MKKRDVVTLVIIGIIFLIIFIISMISRHNNDIKSKTEFNELTLLNDENMFWSVSNNINNICLYSSSNTQALDLILKDEIDDELYKNTSFQAKEIYVVSRLGIYKYFVKGDISKEEYNQNYVIEENKYFLLNYDMDNNTYEIELITKERYDNASKEEYNFESIEKNEHNIFEFSSLSQKGRATIYFYDFINKAHQDPIVAYDLIEESTKNQHFDTYKKFEKFISENNNIIIKEIGTDDNNNIGIIDNYGNEYIFKINGVLNYKVTINKTEE